MASHSGPGRIECISGYVSTAKTSARRSGREAHGRNIGTTLSHVESNGRQTVNRKHCRIGIGTAIIVGIGIIHFGLAQTGSRRTKNRARNSSPGETSSCGGSRKIHRICINALVGSHASKSNGRQRMNHNYFRIAIGAKISIGISINNVMRAGSCSSRIKGGS